MADGKIEIDLELNDSGAQKQGKKAGEDIAKGVESGLKDVKKNADSSAKDASKSFQTVADSAKSSFSDVGSAAKSGFSDVGDAAKTASSDASSAFENVPADAAGSFSDVSSEAESGFDGVADAANTAAGDAASSFQQIPEAAGTAGEQVHEALAVKTVAAGNLVADAFEAAAAKVIDLGKQAIGAGMDFDKSMSQVAATMGVSVDEVSELRDFAQEMGQTTAFSASEAAEALNYMALAGYDAETSMRVLPTVLNLAAAGNMDLAAASDMVTDAQSALGLSVDDAEVMVDQMAKTSSKTNTSVEQLGSAFLTVGGTAKNLKGGTKELSQMLGILADNGVKGSEGGTALRNVILSLSAPTDKAADAIKDLGVKVFDAEGNMRSMPDIMADMNSAMDGMSQEKRTNVLNTIFNKVDLKSVNALLGTSADRFDEVSAAIDDAQGSAEQMANTQLDNLAGDVTLMESAMEGFFIALSDNLAPMLRDIVQFLTNDVFPALTDMADNFEDIVPHIGAVLTALASFAAGFKIVKAFRDESSLVGTACKNMGVDFQTAGTKAKLGAVGVTAMRTALKALGSVGIMLALTAITEAITYFWQESEKAKERSEKLDKATGGLRDSVLGVAGVVSDEADAMSDLAGAVDRVDLDEFLDQHARLADSIKESNEEVQGNKRLLSDYRDTIDELGGKADLTDEELADLKIAVDNVNEACGTSYEVTKKGGEGYKIMADDAEVAKDKILDVIDAQMLQMQAEADMENYKDVYKQAIKDNEDLGKAKQNLADAQAEYDRAYKNYFETSGGTAEDAQAAKAAFESAEASLNKANDELRTLESTTKATADTTDLLRQRTELNKMAQEKGASAFLKAAAINDDYRSGVQGAGIDLIEFTKALDDYGISADDAAKITQDDAIAMAKGWKSGTDDLIRATADAGLEVPKKLLDMGSKSAQSYADGIAKTREAAKQEAEKIADEAANEVKKIEDEFEKSGENAGQGFANGLNKKLGEVTGRASALAGAAIAAIMKTGEEHSPWKTTYRSGVNAAKGLINGIKSHYKGAKKSGKTLAESIIDGANKRLSNLKGVYDVSAKYEVGYWTRIRKSVKKGSDAWYEATKNLRAAKKRQVEDAKKANDQIISNAQKHLERYKLTHNVSLAYEEKYWKKYLKKVKKGSDAYYTALSNLVNVRKQKAEQVERQRDTILQNANDHISRQRRLYGMSYQQEADYWKKVLKKLKKGTKQYKEANDNYLEARKNAAEEVKEQNQDLLDAEQDYVDKLRDIQAQLAEDVQAAKDAYLDAVAERKSAVLSDMNTFEAYYKKVTIGGDKLIENLRKQVAATKDYEDGMKALEKRIGKGDLYDEIASMGMEGLRYVESLNQMSDEQIKEFVSLYKQRNDIAQREAERQSKDDLAQMNKTIKNLNDQAAKQMNEATAELKKKASELNTALSKSVAKMASNVKASSNSIVSSINKAVSALTKLDKRVTNTAPKATTKSYIASPEQQVPVATVYNGRQAITDANGVVQGYTLMANDLYGPTRQTEMSLIRGMEALTVAMREASNIGGDQHFYQTNEFYSPVASPDEFAREMRIQQHYGLAGQWL